MKTLYIVRHGKSSWDDFNLSDHERDLLPVGVRRTKKIARWLVKNHKTIPDKIISSSAVRARKTASILAKGLSYPEENIEIDPDFYHADTEQVLSKLYTLPDRYKTVMIVGHNMTFNDLANEFLDWQHQIENLPTSGVVAIKIDTEKWVSLSAANSELDFILFPKMLKK
jgi:phosphohistidine phosphatase